MFTTNQVIGPPSWPLYPEPNIHETDAYILHENSHRNLPKKFEAMDPGMGVVVHPTGRVEVTAIEQFPTFFDTLHAKWSCYYRHRSGMCEGDYGHTTWSCCEGKPCYWRSSNVGRAFNAGKDSGSDTDSDFDIEADIADFKRFQGPGRRWSHIPWTKEQEESCRSFRIRIPMKIWLSVWEPTCEEPAIKVENVEV